MVALKYSFLGYIKIAIFVSVLYNAYYERQRDTPCEALPTLLQIVNL